MIEAICERCGDAFNPHEGRLESDPAGGGDIVGITETGARIYRHFVRTCDAPEQGEECGGLGIEVACYGGDPDLLAEISAVYVNAWKGASRPEGARLPYPLRPSSEPGTVIVSIPGSFYATFEGTLSKGRITRMVFQPSAGAAGYFGPSAQAEDAVEHPHMLKLDVEETDGPFWRAMQAALVEQTWVRVDSDGDDGIQLSDEDVVAPTVPIRWEE